MTAKTSARQRSVRVSKEPIHEFFFDVHQLAVDTGIVHEANTVMRVITIIPGMD